jgi:hypothetical protein
LKIKGVEDRGEAFFCEVVENKGAAYKTEVAACAEKRRRRAWVGEGGGWYREKVKKKLACDIVL